VVFFDLPCTHITNQLNVVMFTRSFLVFCQLLNLQMFLIYQCFLHSTSQTQHQYAAAARALNGYPGSLPITQIPGQYLRAYLGIFITQLLSTQQCRYVCVLVFGVIYNVYHEFNVSLHANCKYDFTTHH